MNKIQSLKMGPTKHPIQWEHLVWHGQWLALNATHHLPPSFTQSSLPHSLLLLLLLLSVSLIQYLTLTMATMMHTLALSSSIATIPKHHHNLPGIRQTSPHICILKSFLVLVSKLCNDPHSLCFVVNFFFCCFFLQSYALGVWINCLFWVCCLM